MSAETNNSVSAKRSYAYRDTQQRSRYQSTEQNMKIVQRGWRVAREAWLGVVAVTQIAMVLAGALIALPLASAAAKTPEACAALQAKYPSLSGKTLVNAVNAHTPGYEALDPNDPSKYVGFDIDLGEAIGDCLGLKVTYKPVTFASLLTTLEAGQADIYATKERAKAADFVTYLKVYDGVLVAKGNPKKINGINLSMCGATAAENTGFVEVPLVQALEAQCKAAGKPAPEIQLYDNNANCIQAILSGRADTYVNDVNTVDGAVKAYPDKLEKATAVTLPYSVGIAVPRNKTDFRDAVSAALTEIQKSGLQTELMKKWSLPEAQMEAPKLVIAD
jgi:polar amino acid transport system substrate-binding protein